MSGSRLLSSIKFKNTCCHTLENESFLGIDSALYRQRNEPLLYAASIPATRHVASRHSVNRLDWLFSLEMDLSN